MFGKPPNNSNLVKIGITRWARANTQFVTRFGSTLCFYRAMHYSAKRGRAIACRLSVRLTVTLVDCDHIGWNSSKIISRLVSMGRSLSADQNIIDLLQGEQPEIWAQSDTPSADLSVGDIRSQIAAEWLQMAQWSQWRAYRSKPPSLFRMVPSLTPYDLPLNGVPFHIPKIREWPYLRNG